MSAPLLSRSAFAPTACSSRPAPPARLAAPCTECRRPAWHQYSSSAGVWPRLQQRALGLPARRRGSPVRAEAGSSQDDGEPPVQYNTEFGYSRKDVVLIGVAIMAAGYGLYYGLQWFAGLDPGAAGNWVQLVVVLGLCLGWISTYLFRVANKDMTYVKQLEAYEAAVMQKRLEELPESEVERLMGEVEAERQRRAGKGQSQPPPSQR